MMFYSRFCPELLALLKRLVERGSSVLDVGAQIGYVTANLARLVGPGGSVHSFEPDPNARERLQRTIAANDCRCVTVFPVAAGARDEELVFNLSPTLGWSTAVAGTHHHHLKPITVQGLRIDTLAARGELRRPIRFVKIDVEGFECSVLDGMAQLLAEDAPLVLAEVNDLMLRPNGHTTRDLLERLSRHGHRLFVVTERPGLLNGGQVALRPTTPEEALPFCDVLAVPRQMELTRVSDLIASC
jgi:FkbM family methyltransferase